jgi:hypothetical protein
MYEQQRVHGFLGTNTEKLPFYGRDKSNAVRTDFEHVNKQATLKS